MGSNQCCTSISVGCVLNRDCNATASSDGKARLTRASDGKARRLVLTQD
jgi:hypothetical protein